MKHAKMQELEFLADLIDFVRSLDRVREKSPGHFYFRGKNILHFHIQDNSICADTPLERINVGTALIPNQEMIRYIKMLIGDLVVKNSIKNHNKSDAQLK